MIDRFNVICAIKTMCGSIYLLDSPVADDSRFKVSRIDEAGGGDYKIHINFDGKPHGVTFIYKHAIELVTWIDGKDIA